MTSLYKVLQKSVPNCSIHLTNESLHYNIDQQKFLCQECIHSISNTTFQEDENNNKYKSRPQGSIFTLKQIVQNPILLMVRQNSFLSQISQQSNRYHVDEFLKILTDIDFVIKTKKSAHQITREFFTHLKHQINMKIDWILSKSQENLRIMQEIQDNTSVLKRINNDYYNQFLQTIEETYIDGTTEQLKELLRKYSTENENPFRRIEEKIGEITRKISSLTEINWEHVIEVERKVLDPYMWSGQKIFMMANQLQLRGKTQTSVILPNSFPHRLGFQQEQNKKQCIQDSINEERSAQDETQNQIYVKCFSDSIQILQKSIQLEDEFALVDKFQCSQSQIDMLHELPQKILMTISYHSIKFYTYQFNKITFKSEISTLKGCSQVLIFQNFCILLAQNRLYRVRYSQLTKCEQVKPQISESQHVVKMKYLFKDRRKLQSQILVTKQNHSTGQCQDIRLNLY